MAKVTEHDSEEERERNKDWNSRIDLLISSSTIGVDNGLKALSELVGLQVSRRRLVSLNLVDDGRNRETSSVSNILQRGPD